MATLSAAMLAAPAANADGQKIHGLHNGNELDVAFLDLPQIRVQDPAHNLHLPLKLVRRDAYLPANISSDMGHPYI